MYQKGDRGSSKALDAISAGTKLTAVPKMDTMIERLMHEDLKQHLVSDGYRS